MTTVGSLVHELGPVGIGIAIGIGIAASQPLFIAATQWLAQNLFKVCESYSPAFDWESPSYRLRRM